MTSSPLTEAKLAANRLNAQFSSGPRTEQGKSRVSGNALSFGLFALRDFVRADEQEDYHILRQNLLAHLRPEGVLELAHTGEILSATWRLLRCGLLEATMSLPDNEDDPTSDPIPDPMEDPKNVKLQTSIDRARTQAWNLLRRATAELERLQARRASKPASSAPPVSTKQTHPSPAAPTPPHPQTPRNALCPCHSGQKFKRCCGRNAQPVLHVAA